MMHPPSSAAGFQFRVVLYVEDRLASPSSVYLRGSCYVAACFAAFAASSSVTIAFT
jgi:hypothetical protein